MSFFEIETLYIFAPLINLIYSPMQKLLALCSMLLLAIMLSASLPVKVELKQPSQPVTVISPASQSVTLDQSVPCFFEWPEMPFAGFVPCLGFALESPLDIGYLDVAEHPPNNSLFQGQATHNFSTRDPIAYCRAGSNQKGIQQPNRHLFAPYIRWLN